MVNKNIEVGQIIRDKVFNGNNYAQMNLLRQSIWALAVLNDNIVGDKIKAEEILNKSFAKDIEIESILKQYYPEEYEE